ncbi:hypothetical protein MKW98_007392 [Papaver atlanticum]|uniref:Helitron helicase-like domain-containing protein n=1 Tax=Papaver atlanticum TaxID=357466 RepID=A0AAD4XCH5_9MAGN|nr:hypothetical protein MKW98_007392 [Papaver atlanticum]
MSVPGQSPRFIGQVQLRDEEATEASRKKKGKSVVMYQRRRRANVSYVPDGNIVGGIVIGSTRENNNHESTDDNSSDDGENYDIYEQDNAEAIAKNVVSELRPSTIGASTSTTSTSRVSYDLYLFKKTFFVAQLPLRRSPRFSQQPQRGEPSHTQNAIVTNDNLASNLNLRRSPRFMGQAQSQQSRHTQNATSNPQGVQVGRGRGRPLLSVAGRSSFLNCARGITYKVGFKKFHLPPPGTCPKWQAMIFYREPKGFCCSDGKVVLPFVAPPIELLELYDDQMEVGVHFRRYVQRYNQCFSLTSIWVNYDRELADNDNREGVYTFRVQGDIYHRIGSLLPPVVENETDPPTTVRPRYIQMYIYDTDNEINWRMEEGGNDLNREVMEKLRIILDTHNRFVHVIRPLAQREDIQRCRLVIKEQPATEKQYTLPTASQVATIIAEGDGSEKPGERDIVVRTTEGKLLFINETLGCYDPLQYPPLLPYGSYGWD